MLDSPIPQTPAKSTVHIGLHKTGSTTLQHALYEVRSELDRHGFYYPADFLPHKQQHSDLGIYLRTSRDEEYRRAFEHILEGLASREASQLLLSGEEFSTLHERHVKVLRESLETTGRSFQVILYVRNLYRFAISAMAQFSRQGEFIAYPSQVLLRIGRLDIASLVSRWEAVFGNEYVHVACLEALPGDGNILEHFAGIAGIEIPAGYSPEVQNRSVDPLASMLLSHLAHEFGLPHEPFYRSYFRVTARPRLPKTDRHLADILGPWVAQVNLSHPKLAPYRQILSEPPRTDPDGQIAKGADYLRSLAAVLNKAAAVLEMRENAGPASKDAHSHAEGAD